MYVVFGFVYLGTFFIFLALMSIKFCIIVITRAKLLAEQREGLPFTLELKLEVPVRSRIVKSKQEKLKQRDFFKLNNFWYEKILSTN